MGKLRRAGKNWGDDYEGLQVLLPFLDTFDQPRYSHGRWVDLQGGWRGFEFAPPTEAFFNALYDRGIVYSFDWGAWQEEGIQLYEDPVALSRADAPTLRKLLTLHARKDHFAEGHLATVA